MKRASKLPHWPPRLPGLTGWFHWKVVPKVLLAIGMTVVLTALVFFYLDYYQIGSRLEQFRADQAAPQDVIAPGAVTWTDTKATDLKRDEAAKLVQTAYYFNAKAAPTAHAQLDALFQQIRLALSERASSESPALSSGTIPPLVIDAASQLDAASFTRLRAVTHDMLNQMVRDQESYTEDDAAQRLETLAKSRAIASNQQLILTTLSKAALHAAWSPEPQAFTAERQQKAREAVPVVTHAFQRSEIIIHKGDIVSESDLAQLKQKQLLQLAPFQRVLPLAVIILFAVAAVGIYLRNYVRQVYDDNRKLLLLAGLVIASLGATLKLGGGDREYLVGLIFIPAAAMAIAGLLDMPTAIVSTILMSAVAGLCAENQFVMTLLAMGSALTGMMVVSSIWPASRATIPAVISLMAVDFMLRLSLETILPGNSSGSLWAQLSTIMRDAGAGGFGATMFAVGAIYLLARPFGITTHYRLMELSNPNEPLLRKMMKEAPGSYHSSVMVANIAEAAADAVGANALLTRVAALYHDVGKLKRPGFFVENQAPLGLENMHQRLTPKLSYLILISHVKDGADTAREYKLPAEVVNIVREHHGTTLAAYFYHRAVSEAGEETIPEHEFRYPGPKPSTKESAVVMLSDSVQASVKSLKDPTPGRIENMVNDIIANRLDDGQFEDCDLTLRDLRKIAEVFIRILSGLYTYTRIEYPDIKTEGMRTRANLNPESAPTAGEPAPAAPGS